MSTNDYDLGYGKPPNATQFKPGQSGNPKGRPKGVQNLATDLEEELAEKVLVTEGGKQTKTTKQRAMLKTLFAKALKGDARSAGILLNLIIGVEQAKSSSPDEAFLDDGDREILEAYRDHLLEKSSSDEGGSSNG